MDEEILFTSAAVLDFLSQIDELKDKDLHIDKSIDGQLQITIGESTYSISNANATTVDVPETTIDTISDATIDAYNELLDDNATTETSVELSNSESAVTQIDEDAEKIEGGIIKNLVKDLMLGGMIRFAKNHLLQ